MGHSSPVQPDDQHGHRFSGVAVVLALFLLAVCGAGLTVAMYFATRSPPRARPEAVEKTDRLASTASGAPSSAASVVRHPTPPSAQKPQAVSPTPPQTPAAKPEPTRPSQGHAPDAGRVLPDAGRPRQESEPSGFDVTTLTPIEVQAAVADKDAWRRSVTIGGRAYAGAVCLRPAEDQGTTQIAFSLGSRFDRLRGVAGIADAGPPGGDDSAADRPQAVFRVYGDGNLLWESKRLVGRGAQQAFECRVAGVDLVTFVAESHSPARTSNLAWAGLRTFSGEERQNPPLPPRSS